MIPLQTGKYVKSLIDGQIYCRKNGQFARHLSNHGLTYETYYQQYIGQTPSCICGKPCTFKQSTMSYLSTCGNSKCTGRSISKTKQKRTDEQWRLQRERFRQTMSNKTTQQLQDIVTKRIDTFRKRNGVDHRLQINISESSLEKLSDHDWMKFHHHDLQMTAVKIAEELNVGVTTATNWLHRHNIDIKLYRCSQVQRDVIQTLNCIDNSIRIIQNDRTSISPLELDIFLPDYNVAIEINGIFWHGETKGKTQQYHLNKTKMCQQQGIRLIHIYDVEWANKQSIVISRLSNILNRTKQVIYARQCTVKNISPSQAKLFFEKNHIQGHTQSRYNYGLYHKNKLVAAMNFGTSRFDKQSQYELIRFCCCLNTRVVGGASKLFKKFINDYNPSSIVSYSDKRWNTGNVYKQLGFVYQHDSAPNFHVFKTNNPFELFSRHKFQKHKLHGLLDSFDPSKTAWLNLQENGYDRIWDCGNGVYKWIVVK